MVQRSKPCPCRSAASVHTRKSGRKPVPSARRPRRGRSAGSVQIKSFTPIPTYLIEAKMNEPRILTDNETYARRRQQASSVGGKVVALCAAPGCPRAAANSPWCIEHRPTTTSVPIWPARDFSEDEYAALRAQVETDAAPLFVIAMSWIARQRVAHLGITLDSLEASMNRLRGELAGSADMRPLS